MLKRFLDGWASRWAVIGLTLGVLLALPVFDRHLYDDAYIHARLAEHALAWGIPVFNAGDAFKAGSSSGFVLLIALVGQVVDLVFAIRIIGFLSLTLCVAAMCHLAGRAHVTAPRWMRVLAALSPIPYLLLAGYGGMETPVACMLMAFSAVAIAHGRQGLAVFWMALAAWFRFEVMLLLALMSLHLLVRGPRKALAGVFPLILLAAFDLHVFGTVVPHAAKVKSVAYGFPWAQSLANALSFGQPYGKPSMLLGGMLLVVWGMAGLQLLREQKVPAPPHIFLLLSAGVFLAWAMGRTVIFQWYFCILVCPFCLFILLDGRSPPAGTLLRRFELGFKASILILFFCFGCKSLKPVFGKGESAGANFRVVRYAEIGAGLYVFCPSCALLTSEIGGLGYSFKGRVYDAFGLGDPEAIRFHPMKVPQERQGFHVGAIPPEYVRLRLPDFVVSMPVFSVALRASGVLHNYFSYDCPLDVGSRVSIFGDRKIQVYSKRAVPPSNLRAMGCRPA